MENQTTSTPESTELYNELTPEITANQYQEAREIAARYERRQAEIAAEKRAAYAVPVVALVNSEAYLDVYTAVMHILETQTPDGYFDMTVQALSTIMPNLAANAGYTLTLPQQETPEGE